MFYIIRNGEYLESEKILIDDIEVPQKPHSNAEYINGEWILNIDTYLSQENKKEAQEFLDETDWKIIRHKEQLDLGIETSLTDEEYLDLIKSRQEKREVLNDIII